MGRFGPLTESPRRLRTDNTGSCRIRLAPWLIGPFALLSLPASTLLALPDLAHPTLPGQAIDVDHIFALQESRAPFKRLHSRWVPSPPAHRRRGWSVGE